MSCCEPGKNVNSHVCLCPTCIEYVLSTEPSAVTSSCGFDEVQYLLGQCLVLCEPVKVKLILDIFPFLTGRDVFSYCYVWKKVNLI